MIALLFFSLIQTSAFADCIKPIKVESYSQKALPSLLNFGQKTYANKITTIHIKCELYNQISVGDTLIDEEIDLNLRGGVFGAPVEHRKYKVLNKNP